MTILIILAVFNTANVGLGYRIKSGEAIYGVNLFGDYMKTKTVSHGRVSYGLEYLKNGFSALANYYKPVSGKKYLREDDTHKYYLCGGLLK